MKGPGVRVDQDVRRFWRCPLCGKVTRTAGRVTTAVCLCTGEPRWMQLEPTPRRPRYVPPPRELEPVEEYILPPDPPRAKPPVAVAETAESPTPAPFGEGLDLLAAESGLVIETEFHVEPVGEQNAETPPRIENEAAADERGTGERRPPRGPRPPRGDSRDRPPRPGRGGGRPQGGQEAGPGGPARAERGRQGNSPARSGRRPDRPGPGPRRHDAGGPPLAEAMPGDPSPLSAGPGDEVSEVSAGGLDGGAPPVSPGGLETGSNGPGRRRRRGGQREGQPRAGGGTAPPPREGHSSGRTGRPEKGPPRSDSPEGRPPHGGGVPGGTPAQESQAGDDTSAGLTAGTDEGRGRRQRRRRRGGRGPQGPDTSAPGQPKPDGPSETFGEGLA